MLRGPGSEAAGFATFAHALAPQRLGGCAGPALASSRAALGFGAIR